MSKKAKYKAKPQSHDGDYDVVDSEGWSICTAFTQANARKIARALNAMEAKPKAKPFEFDWSGIDPRYKWAAMDADEAWFAFAAKPDGSDPESAVFTYNDQDARSLEIDRPPYPGDWRESLQKRP